MEGSERLSTAGAWGAAESSVEGEAGAGAGLLVADAGMEGKMSVDVEAGAAEVLGLGKEGEPEEAVPGWALSSVRFIVVFVFASSLSFLPNRLPNPIIMKNATSFLKCSILHLNLTTCLCIKTLVV